MRAGPGRSPTLSCGRAAYRSGGTFWLTSLKGRDRAERGYPAIAARNHSVPATTNENFRHAGSRRECLQAARRGIEPDGSRESKFPPDDRYATDHICQFLPCSPTGRLTESAVRREGQSLRRSVFQAETHPIGDIARSFNVIAFYV